MSTPLDNNDLVSLAIDGHPTTNMQFATTTRDFQTRHDSETMHEAIVEFELAPKIVLLQFQVGGRQQSAGKEVVPAKSCFSHWRFARSLVRIERADFFFSFAQHFWINSAQCC